jgi:hypothetical protein
VSLPTSIVALALLAAPGCVAEDAQSGTSNETEVCMPRCDAIGSRSEGWYDCDGQLIGWAQCAQCVAECRAKGTRSEGWYSSCDDHLIKWDLCAAYAPSTPCQDAGGACVGISDTTCVDGQWGDADAYSCGDAVGVGCCLPVEPAANACEEAGGQCVGLSPSGCADGEWADAETYSCGDALGVGCCMPSEEAP